VYAQDVASTAAKRSPRPSNCCTILPSSSSIDAYGLDFDGDPLYYPQDLELDFHSDQRLFISVSAYQWDHDTLFPATENIAVTYSDETARRHRIGPFMYPAPDADTSL